MRWYTCTPVNFRADAEFFARDSGLLCHGFQALGVESRAVLIGPTDESDYPETIRTEYKNLESAAWWREQQLDGVVLYAWGAPKYRQVARAIHQSGTTLVLNQDSSGLVSPLVHFRDWAYQHWLTKGPSWSFSAIARLLLRIVRSFVGSFVRTDWLRAVHLRQGDLIACVSPGAVELYCQLCVIYGGRRLARKVVLLPHPVTMDLAQESVGQKRCQIVTIGRWDDEAQKRPHLLMRVMSQVLSSHAQAELQVIGTTTAALSSWHRALPGAMQQRIHLHGRLPHDQIRALLQSSQVFYSSSAYESFGIAAAEALCCGCSVVAAEMPTMNSFGWFVSQNSGSLAKPDLPAAHVKAVLHELKLWADGARHGEAIAQAWRSVLPADRVAATVLELSGRIGRRNVDA